jgi:hypothetical protein
MKASDEQEVEKVPLTFEERLAAKRRVEEEQDAQDAEKLRQAYLKRTGRTKMKP